jgi:hypothetical protein
LLVTLLSKRLGKFMFHLILLMIKSQINPCRVEEIMKNASKNWEKFLRDSGSA